MKKYYKLGALKKALHDADMFKAPACLRATGEPEVSRLCPGILSALLCILFLYILIDKLVNVATYKQISSNRVYQTTNNLSSPYASNFSMSISPAWLDYADWKSMFDLTINYVLTSPTGTSLTLASMQIMDSVGTSKNMYKGEFSQKDKQRERIKNNLDIQSDLIVNEIMKLTILFEEARKIQLNDEMKQTERRIAQAFIKTKNNNSKIKQKVMDTIPLIILLRISNKIDEISTITQNQIV